MSNPFDYVTSINFSKKYMIEDDITEKAYVPYMTNRSLSYFQDTVAVANAMNQYHNLDNKMQYDFLYSIVARRKRFGKWIKPDVIEDIDAVKEYYGYSNDKAKSALGMLSTEQLNEIKERLYKGGKKALRKAK